MGKAASLLARRVALCELPRGRRRTTGEHVLQTTEFGQGENAVDYTLAMAGFAEAAICYGMVAFISGSIGLLAGLAGVILCAVRPRGSKQVPVVLGMIALSGAMANAWVHYMLNDLDIDSLLWALPQLISYFLLPLVHGVVAVVLGLRRKPAGEPRKAVDGRSSRFAFQNPLQSPCSACQPQSRCEEDSQ
jgi:hypothetical protein